MPIFIYNKDDQQICEFHLHSSCQFFIYSGNGNEQMIIHKFILECIDLKSTYYPKDIINVKQLLYLINKIEFRNLINGRNLTPLYSHIHDVLDEMDLFIHTTNDGYFKFILL